MYTCSKFKKRLTMKKKLLSLSILILNTIPRANAVLPHELETLDAVLSMMKASSAEVLPEPFGAALPGTPEESSLMLATLRTQGCYGTLMATVGYYPRDAYDKADLQRDLEATSLPSGTREALLEVFNALALDEQSAPSPVYPQSRALLGCLLSRVEQGVGDPGVSNEWNEALRPRLLEIEEAHAAQGWLCGLEYLHRLMLGSLPLLRRVVLVCAQNEQAPCERDIFRVRSLSEMDSDAVEAAATLLDSKP